MIKYFAHAWIGHTYTFRDYILQEVFVIKKEYDEENESYFLKCRVIKDYFDEDNKNRHMLVDNEWQLYDTLIEAKRVLVKATLSNDIGYFDKPR